MELLLPPVDVEITNQDDASSEGEFENEVHDVVTVGESYWKLNISQSKLIKIQNSSENLIPLSQLKQQLYNKDFVKYVCDKTRKVQ